MNYKCGFLITILLFPVILYSGFNVESSELLEEELDPVSVFIEEEDMEEFDEEEDGEEGEED